MPQHLNFPHIIDSDAPFSSLVLDDRYAFLAGVVAADFADGVKALGDVGAETKAVMDVMGKLLAEIGLGFADVVRSDVHLKNLSDMDAMNQVYRSYFADGAFPARTCVQSEA